MYNFAAGPAAIPGVVLEEAQRGILNWQGSGLSVLELGHRGPAFKGILDAAIADLRTLMQIPDNYQVLMMQGGAQMQFAMVPLNLISPSGRADYINTGHWSTIAIAEAARFGTIREAASSADSHYLAIPPRAGWELDSGAAFVHYTSNETIGGVEFSEIPDTGSVPLVADMSSNILSRVVDVSRFGLIYAGAQKNIGPAGLTIVIVRDDLLERALPITPKTMHYQAYAQAGSLYNTPNTFGIYLAGIVFQWLLAQGGVTAIEAINQEKAALLYRIIDASAGFYSAPVVPAARSRMNVVFRLKEGALEAPFLQESHAAGLFNLKGHRVVGGMRASLYNAMPLAGVSALVAFMQDFARRYG